MGPYSNNPNEEAQNNDPIESDPTDNDETSDTTDNYPSIVTSPQTKTDQNNTATDTSCMAEVVRLLSTANIRGKRHYHVKWRDQSRTTWEPEENIPESLKREYHINRTLKGRKRKRIGRSTSAFKSSH